MNRNKVCVAAGVLAGAALLAGAYVGTASAMASGNGGNRSGVIQGSGTAYAKSSGVAYAKKGALTAPRTTESGGVKQMVTAGNSIGIASDNGSGWVQGNGLSVTWTWGSTGGNGSVNVGGVSTSWTWGPT